jgi:hypothetical protein
MRDSCTFSLTLSIGKKCCLGYCYLHLIEEELNTSRQQYGSNEGVLPKKVNQLRTDVDDYSQAYFSKIICIISLSIQMGETSTVLHTLVIKYQQ